MSRKEVCPYSFFRWCGYFWGPWVLFVTTDEFSVRVTKITSRIGVSWTHSLPFCFSLFLTQWIMTILSNECKPDNFEPHNSLKLSWRIFEAFVPICWMWIFPWIKFSWHSGSVWHELGWFNWFWQFSVRGYLPLIRKDSVFYFFFFFYHLLMCLSLETLTSIIRTG